MPDKLIWFANGQLALPMYCGLQTGLFFEWLKQDGRFYLLKTGHKLCPENNHLNTGLSGFQMVTVDVIYMKSIQNIY
jgi:hypothetical protein